MGEDEDVSTEMDPGLLERDDWESIQSCLRGFRVAVRWARGWDASVWD